jgi:outer membrane protein
MTTARFKRSQITTIGLILSQALGFISCPTSVFAQVPNEAARPALPTPMSASTLIGLEQPPQMVPPPTKAALPNTSAPSNVTGTKAGDAKGQLADLIQLYQEAAFSDPVLNAARFNYQASKEL